MIESSHRQTKMTEKAQLILAQLKFVNPTNIHLKTNAPQHVRDAFHSVFFRHTPSAARYMMLPYIYDGRVEFTS